MDEKFAGLQLRDELISYRQRTFTLQDVRARLEPVPATSPSGAHSARRGRGKGDQNCSLLIVDGPGFCWQIPVAEKRTERAEQLLAAINSAARRYGGLSAVSGILDDDAEEELDAPEPSPIFLEHALRAPDRRQLSRHRSRLAR